MSARRVTDAALSGVGKISAHLSRRILFVHRLEKFDVWELLEISPIVGEELRHTVGEHG